ncbi:hypothetical protein P5763_28485 [Bacillus cereus]|nr:hypothetical protein [Bacillus cereus]
MGVIMKTHITIKQITKIIETETQKLSDDVIRRRVQIDSTIAGREEDITSKLETKLSEDLNERLTTALKEYEGKITFEVYPFKKTEEKRVGADLCGIVDINHNGKRIVKYFLAQSKVCSVKQSKAGKVYYKGGDSNLNHQIEDMLSITSDSFVFIYSEDGIFATPAFGIRGSNGKIDTRSQYYKSLGSFYAEFFKCFVGDHKVGELDLNTLSLKEIIKLVKAKFIHYIKIDIGIDKD